MTSLPDRILDAIRDSPLDDDVLARRLDVKNRQTINQTARRMAARGLLKRVPGPDGKLAPRMYYYADTAKTKKAYIGYIGVHLMNTKTN